MDYVVIIGLAAILLILLVLIRTVRDYGTAIRSIQNRPAGSAENAGTAPTPAVEAGVPEEVVAAISAAVYCMYPGAAVKFIRRSAERPQSAWKMAGLLENTHPF